jgi:excinuclease ABC subunit C
MDDLFPLDDTLDLGASTVFPEGWRPRRTRVEGARPSQLRTQIRLMCPTTPGVYLMFDGEGKIIYVGKAKNLRVRVLSYFRSRSRVPKARKIVAQAKSIAWEVLPSEFTALLRELELIRRWRPPHNVQGQPLRRRHAYLCLGGAPAPYLFLTRRVPKDLVAAFGPLPVTRRTRQAVRWLNDLFRLRDCPPGPVTFFPDRAELFPLPIATGCLRLELGTCLGPCLPDTSARDYRRQTAAVQRFLEGSDTNLVPDLDRQMVEAAQSQNYERAARLRDQHDSLIWLLERLTRVRQARKTLSLIYPLVDTDGRTWWYLVHGARVLGCVFAPTTATAGEIVTTRLRTIYALPVHESLLDAYEPVDGMMLILSWFRKFPKERRRAISVEHAQAQAADAGGVNRPKRRR